jgi:preprotein translocase subunit SecD
VLRGVPALSGADITDPHSSTLPGGEPAVSFSFTAPGGRDFQALTAAIARRGTLVSGLGESLNQHFAVVLDGRLIEVPYVDYKVYPDGVSPAGGVQLGGGLCRQSARDIAILLRYGPLPIQLTATA